MNTKIIVALVLGIVLVGLTGATAAFEFPYFGSYAHTSISYTSPTLSIQEDYFGSHSCAFSQSGISTQTDITIYPSASLLDSYVPSTYPSPSVSFSSYGPSEIPASRSMIIDYNFGYNGDTVSGTLVDSVPPIYIEETISVGNQYFNIVGHSDLHLASSYGGFGFFP